MKANHDRLRPIERAPSMQGVLHDTETPVASTTTSELRRKLDRNDDFVLVMAMDRVRYDRAHIGGSIDLEAFRDLTPGLASDTEIVVYCTDAACAASILGAAMIARAGFTDVSRYAGGLAMWAEAGLPLVTGMPRAA